MTRTRLIAATLALSAVGALPALIGSASAAPGDARRGLLCVERDVCKRLHLQVGYCQ